MKKTILFAGLLAASGIALPAGAATIDALRGQIVAAPVSVANGYVFNWRIQAFDEAQDVTLSSAVSVNGGRTIAAGTIVDSHMIFLNSRNGVVQQHYGVTGLGDSGPVRFTFDGEILGVMADINGLREAASNSQLGAPGTSYPGAFADRGLEENAWQTRDNDWFVYSGDTIWLGMNVSQPGDWMRVVTRAPAAALAAMPAPAVVPVPAAGLLLGFGLGALSLLRRRRRSA